ncbi:hypothetical protein QC756_13155 [Sinorhizobium meliloti]|uniref:hypothetical protein n=1 Tax=Rhizobium meliloti TaxID=382 RepID=UPI00244DF0E8|nr:hypothetical protein [Sinorhizobium meliloti]WGI73313.1 hypothetical protein QC756_13155 [Sinorhizobium meliloti]
MSSFTAALPYLFTGFSGALLIWLLYWYVRSLWFYWRNGWDFSVDFGPPMPGDEFHSSENEMRPREKVMCGYPITLLISAYIFGMSVYFFWGH